MSLKKRDSQILFGNNNKKYFTNKCFYFIFFQGNFQPDLMDATMPPPLEVCSPCAHLQKPVDPNLCFISEIVH